MFKQYIIIFCLLLNSTFLLAEYEVSEDVLAEFPVVIWMDKSSGGATSQQMKVYVEGRLRYWWYVSTGREKTEESVSGRRYFSATPVGWFSPTRLVLDHWSNLWDASMKWSVFFHGGVAIHATTESHFSDLGNKASGGCVRLHPKAAETLYSLVESYGQGLVPIFSRSGEWVFDSKKQLRRQWGWRSLIIVEDRR